MLRHIVMWRLKDSVDKAAAAQQIKAALEALPPQIPEIRSLEVGINTLPGDTASDVVLITEHNCENCLATYQQHPAHQDVVSLVKGLACERRSVDYVTD